MENKVENIVPEANKSAGTSTNNDNKNCGAPEQSRQNNIERIQQRKQRVIYFRCCK